VQVVTDENADLLAAVDDDINQLVDEHLERREHWYFHEHVPWERGESFKDKPWDKSQATIPEPAQTALVLNLLTEDNLPYYHASLDEAAPEGSGLKRWGGIWTAEENQHGIAMRAYLMCSRNCDPHLLEDDRLATMKAGWSPAITSPAHLMAYTAIQELATRVSHRNAGKISGDKDCFELMKLIALDENHHFIFYKSVMAAMLRVSPASALEGIYQTLLEFKMPGFVMPNYLRRSVKVAKAGVYNMRIHHDNVLQPVLRDWGIGSLTGLPDNGAELQDRIMELPNKTLEMAERFEARYGDAAVA